MPVGAIKTESKQKNTPAQAAEAVRQYAIFDAIVSQLIRDLNEADLEFLRNISRRVFSGRQQETQALASKMLAKRGLLGPDSAAGRFQELCAQYAKNPPTWNLELWQAAAKDVQVEFSAGAGKRYNPHGWENFNAQWANIQQRAAVSRDRTYKALYSTADASILAKTPYKYPLWQVWRRENQTPPARVLRETIQGTIAKTGQGLIGKMRLPLGAGFVVSAAEQYQQEQAQSIADQIEKERIRTGDAQPGSTGTGTGTTVAGGFPTWIVVLGVVVVGVVIYLTVTA